MRFQDALDTPWVEQGDRFFVGYNEKTARFNLPEGVVAKSINKRFTDGTATRRLGASLIPGNTHWYDPDDVFLASFVYTNPNRDERLILAPSEIGGSTVGINAYNVATDNYFTIDLPVGVTIAPTNTVWFAQAFQYLIMLVGGTPLLLKTYTASGGRVYITNGMYWDGTETGTPTFSWFPEPTDAGGGGPYVLQIVPPAQWSVAVSNRMAYFGISEPSTSNPIFTNNGMTLPDHIFFSDIEIPFQCDPILGDFRINTGEGDHIVSAIPYAYDSLVVFMHKSIHMISNFSALNALTGAADFSQTLQEVITSYQGEVSIFGAFQVGQEIYYWVEKLGLFKLSETLERRLMAHSLPVSDQIQPVIDRINWAAQSKIVCQAQDNYLFFAVPLDESTVNNALLVYNTTTINPITEVPGNWETIDQFNIPNLSIDNLLAVHYGDVRRIVMVSNGPPPAVWLLYDGTQDQTVFSPAAFANIYEKLETRGLGIAQSGPNASNRFQRGTLALDNVSGANITITAIPENGSEKTIRSNVSNAQRFLLRVNDRTMSLRIENTQGTADINAVTVEAMEIKRGLRKVA